jgi:hypothetical protein
MVAAIVAGGVAIAGVAGSTIASGQAASASKSAAGLQMQQYNTTRGDLAPFAGAGQAVLGDLDALAKSGPNGGGTDYLAQAAGLQPGQMTQAQLEATPGYQFNLAQGLKSTQSAAAARGLGVSGAALKGAATFATGLADSTYQNQFNNAQTRFQNSLNLNTAQQSNVTNQFNRLSTTANLGENAAAQTGQAGTSAAASAGNYLNQAGQAAAAGTTGTVSAAAGAANNYLAYQNYQDMTQAVAGTGGYNTGAVNSGVNDLYKNGLLSA